MADKVGLLRNADGRVDVFVAGHVMATEVTHEQAWAKAAALLGVAPESVVVESQSPTDYGYVLTALVAR